ncbi:LOW QUALITY PROTEIN: hypothetical protein HID58_094677 [Brassica napus]|uniref:Uncharacterized protein n=1 Tax=Brassica napus TaxID=3708 RepID=A0ABQ7X6L2_BRANA|nr:LOW QUALITY PROTEIN: hypothetical protein HID58_094677 [Brassica napus]
MNRELSFRLIRVLGILWMKTWSLRIPLISFEEEPYKKRIASAQKKDRVTDAIQTGTGQLNGIPVALGLWIFSLWGYGIRSRRKNNSLIEYVQSMFTSYLVCLPEEHECKKEVKCEQIEIFHCIKLKLHSCIRLLGRTH